MDSKRIGKLVAKLRREKKITSMALAERCGLSQPQISRLENGQQGFRGDTLTRIAAALDVPPAYFFTEEENAVSAAKAKSVDARKQTGMRAITEMQAMLGDIIVTPFFRSLVRRLAFALNRGEGDPRVLKRLIDRIITMKPDARNRLLDRLSERAKSSDVATAEDQASLQEQ